VTTSSRLSAPLSSPWAAWNFWNASGLLISSGVAWIEVALARASTTLVSVSCSKLASPVQLLEIVVAAAGQRGQRQRTHQPPAPRAQSSRHVESSVE
jgi:hypothetical protein